MTLLDTNAIIWLHTRHPRAAALSAIPARLYISPASLLELQFLTEAGRLRLRSGATIAQLADTEEWLVDDPPSADWVEAAALLGWTRDPFDLLLVGHARLRGWRLATGDRSLIDRLGARACVPL
jgi:PIN domain nuclease of toxin-antitoxin system